MVSQKIKSLRTKIPISLQEAIELLKRNNGNIDACEKEFHENKVDEICEIARCEKGEARKFYAKFNFNKEKAIDAINNEQRILTIESTKIAKNSVGFILWFEDENGQRYKTKKRSDIFIPTKDFDYIKKEFESNCSKSFDITANNYFGKEDGKLIIEAIEKIRTDNKNQSEFLNELTEWMNKNFQFAHTLVVYGNL